MWFLANENFPLPSVRLLRQAGYDVASITEDSPGIEDSEVLTRAANEQQVVITFDRDYGELTAVCSFMSDSSSSGQTSYVNA
jgi:predicted nuclease of predicted toxin-antitoxin system